jgi:hypothetical protein
MSRGTSGVKVVGSHTAEGWLMKEGHDLFKNFLDRYFLLDSKERKLTYYEDSQKLKVKGFYTFSSHSVCAANNKQSTQPNVFIVTGNSRNGTGREELVLSAGSDALRRKWLELITKAIQVRELIAYRTRHQFCFILVFCWFCRANRS